LRFRSKMKDGKYVKTVVEGLFRDPDTHTLISKDRAAYENYKQKRQHDYTYKQMSGQIEDLKAEINMLKDMLIKKIGQ
jgi:hypothetical protein